MFTVAPTKCAINNSNLLVDFTLRFYGLAKPEPYDALDFGANSIN